MERTLLMVVRLSKLYFGLAKVFITKREKGDLLTQMLRFRYQLTKYRL